jgi:hypothetical protein
VVGHGWIVSPTVELDQDPQGVQARVPVERPLIRKDAAGTPVCGGEPSCEGGACRRYHRTERRWGGEGRMAEHERRERQVVGRIRDEGGGPVEQRPSFAVDEEIERVEVPVTDDVSPGWWDVVGEPHSRCGQVGPTKPFSGFA